MSTQIPKSSPPGALMRLVTVVTPATLLVLVLALAALVGPTQAIGPLRGQAAHAAITVLEEGRSVAGFGGGSSTAEKPAARDLGTVSGEPILVYGRLGQAGEVDLYKFTSMSATVVPVAVAVPVWPSTRDFRPAALVLPAKLTEGLAQRELPTLISSSLEVVDSGLAERPTFVDGVSAARYYAGGAIEVAVPARRPLAIIVFDTTGRTGAYRLAIGDPRAVGTLSWLGSPGRTARLNLGLFGGGGPDAAPLLGCLAGLGLVGVVAALVTVRLHRRQGELENK